MIIFRSLELYSLTPSQLSLILLLPVQDASCRFVVSANYVSPLMTNRSLDGNFIHKDRDETRILGACSSTTRRFIGWPEALGT